MQPRSPNRGDAPEDLFARYREAGDQAAFSALYDAFGQRLFAAGVRFFRSSRRPDAARAMASDAAQETWIRVIRKRELWDATGGDFASWLMRIHFHSLVDVARRSRSHGRHGSGADADTEASSGPERRLIAVETLSHCLEQLPRDEAAVLMTYYLVDDRRMVCASLGVSDAALRKRIERIKARVRAEPPLARLLEDLGIGKPGGEARDE